MCTPLKAQLSGKNQGKDKSSNVVSVILLNSTFFLTQLIINRNK